MQSIYTLACYSTPLGSERLGARFRGLHPRLFTFDPIRGRTLFETR